MKKYYLLFLAFTTILVSCSSDDSSSGPSFAMTAKINGETFEANNPFGSNQVSGTNVFTYFPETDFILLQAREGGLFGLREIKIWLKKEDIIPGDYSIGPETFSTTPSHFISFLDNSDLETFSDTKEGLVTITSFDTNTRVITGTFELTTTDGNPENPDAVVNYTITEGTFNYVWTEDEQ